jgi:hypothetical protein
MQEHILEKSQISDVGALEARFFAKAKNIS